MSSLISNSAADRDVIVGAETIVGGSARQKTKIGAIPITGGRLLRVSVGYCCNTVIGDPGARLVSEELL